MWNKSQKLMILIWGTIHLKTHSKNAKFSTYCTSPIDWLFELIYIISICTFKKFSDEFNCTAANEIQLEISLIPVKKT